MEHKPQTNDRQLKCANCGFAVPSHDSHQVMRYPEGGGPGSMGWSPLCEYAAGWRRRARELESIAEDRL